MPVRAACTVGLAWPGAGPRALVWARAALQGGRAAGCMPSRPHLLHSGRGSPDWRLTRCPSVPAPLQKSKLQNGPGSQRAGRPSLSCSKTAGAAAAAGPSNIPLPQLPARPGGPASLPPPATPLPAPHHRRISGHPLVSLSPSCPADCVQPALAEQAERLQASLSCCCRNRHSGAAVAQGCCRGVLPRAPRCPLWSMPCQKTPGQLHAHVPPPFCSLTQPTGHLHSGPPSRRHASSTCPASYAGSMGSPWSALLATALLARVALGKGGACKNGGVGCLVSKHSLLLFVAFLCNLVEWIQCTDKRTPGLSQ